MVLLVLLVLLFSFWVDTAFAFVLVVSFANFAVLSAMDDEVAIGLDPTMTIPACVLIGVDFIVVVTDCLLPLLLILLVGFEVPEE